MLISILGFIILYWLFSDFIWCKTIKRGIAFYIFANVDFVVVVPADEFILPLVRQNKEK